MPKAYSYIRFSSAKQEAGDSLARQIRLSEEYAAKHGLELDTGLSLRDLGISAYDRSNLEKGALGHFLRLVEEQHIPVGSYLLVESLDRLSRDKVMDALSIFMDILRAGIVIVTLSDNQVYRRNIFHISVELPVASLPKRLDSGHSRESTRPQIVA